MGITCSWSMNAPHAAVALSVSSGPCVMTRMINCSGTSARPSPSTSGLSLPSACAGGGKPVYGAGSFALLAPPPPPVLPVWSPVATPGGYHRTASPAVPPGSTGGRAAAHGLASLDGGGRRRDAG